MRFAQGHVVLSLELTFEPTVCPRVCALTSMIFDVLETQLWPSPFQHGWDGQFLPRHPRVRIYDWDVFILSVQRLEFLLTHYYLTMIPFSSPITCSFHISSGHRERVPSLPLGFRYKWFSKLPRFSLYNPDSPVPAKKFCECYPFLSLLSEKRQGVWKPQKLYTCFWENVQWLSRLSERSLDLITWRLHDQCDLRNHQYACGPQNWRQAGMRAIWWSDSIM